MWQKNVCVCVSAKTKWVSHWKHVNVVIINTQMTSSDSIRIRIFLPEKLRKYVHASNCFFMFSRFKTSTVALTAKRNCFFLRFSQHFPSPRRDVSVKQGNSFGVREMLRIIIHCYSRMKALIRPKFISVSNSQMQRKNKKFKHENKIINSIKQQKQKTVHI